MHLFKGVEVAVVDKDGREFEEWGEQRLGHIASCYIKSEKDKRFQITIRPNMERWELLFQEKDLWGTHHLLATLRLDGRESLERRVIVYLDQNHRYYAKETDGEVTIKGKKNTDERGNTRLYYWTFQEVGIELLLDNLSLIDTTSSNTDSANDPDTLVEALADLGSSKLADKEEVHGSGLIELTLERVYVEDIARRRTIRTIDNPYAGFTPESTTVKTAHDVKHVAASTDGEIVEASRHEIVYRKVHEDDGVYAKYKFFYRSEDVLRKFGFEGFPPAPDDRGTKKQQPVDKVAAGIQKRKEVKEEEEEEEDDDEDEWFVSKSRSRTTRVTLPVMLKKK